MTIRQLIAESVESRPQVRMGRVELLVSVGMSDRNLESFIGEVLGNMPGQDAIDMLKRVIPEIFEDQSCPG